jgi:hypothetical protein
MCLSLPLRRLQPCFAPTPALRGWWSTALAGAAAAALLTLAQVWPARPAGPRFRDVRELRAWAAGRGLYCRSDWEDGRVTAALAVSTRPLTWGEVGRLCPAAGARLAGKGVLWAVNRSPGLDGMPAPPWDGECRAWGGILVTGDPDFLDVIERGGPSGQSRGSPGDNPFPEREVHP